MAGAVRAVCLLSQRRAARLGEWLGKLAYYAVPSIRRTAQRNIAQTIGKDMSSTEIDRIVRATFINMGYNIVEFLGLPRHRESLKQQVTFVGLEHMDNALSAGRGAILFSGHMTNWEIHGGMFAYLGYPVHPVYKPMSNPLTDRLIYDLRKGFGLELINIREWKERVVQVLSSGEVVGLISDQDASKHGIFVDFLGKPASTFVGPALLTLRHNAALLLTLGHRTSPWHFELEILPALTITPTGDMRRDVAALTALWVSIFDQHVRKYPEQYFWFHRRWKTQPQAPQTDGDAPLGEENTASAADSSGIG